MNAQVSAADRLLRMTPSDVAELRVVAQKPVGRTEIFLALAELADRARPSTVADLDDLYSTGVQLASIWPNVIEQGELAPDHFGRGVAGLALTCGMLRIGFDRVFDLMQPAQREMFHLLEQEQPAQSLFVEPAQSVEGLHLSEGSEISGSLSGSNPMRASFKA